MYCITSTHRVLSEKIIMKTVGMLQCVLIVLMLVTCVKAAGESLHLDPSGPIFRVDAGNDAILDCVLNNGSIDIGGSFSWTKDSNQTLSSTEDGHVTIDLSDSGTVSTLTTFEVHSGDEGQYSCSYTSVGTVTIMVEVISDPHFKNVSEHQVLTEGTDAVVECPAFLGDPPGEMFWFRNSQFINDDRFIGEDGQLTIQNVRQEDAGTYRCSLYRNGTHGSRDITVTVQAQSELAPDIVSSNNHFFAVVYGEPLDITCKLVEPKDNVQYSWMIDTNFEHTYLINTSQHFHRDPYEFHEGRHTCRAENQYGYDEELFFVLLNQPSPVSRGGTTGPNISDSNIDKPRAAVVGGAVTASFIVALVIVAVLLSVILYYLKHRKRNMYMYSAGYIYTTLTVLGEDDTECIPQNSASSWCESEQLPSQSYRGLRYGHYSVLRPRTESDADLIELDSLSTSQSSYFTEAEKRANVPFLDYKQLECDSNGLEYTNVEHDITIRIPEGAVPEGKKIHFEVAVTMYGPFTFPNNTQPISPILWLCILEEDVELQKPFQVVLPHYLAGLDKERVLYHQVVSAKASHNSRKLQNESSSPSYEFQTCEVKPQFAFNGYRGYGVFESNHCCFNCLLVNQTPELAMDASYCLVRIESALTLQRSEVYFAAVYFLGSCLKSLEEQFSEGYRICRYDDFKFNPRDDTTEPHIKVMVPSEHSQCVIAMEPMAAEIRAADIDFWRQGLTVEDMQLRHERKMYPPRVKMTVSMKHNDTLKLPVKFVGCSSNNQLDVELTFPLRFPPPSPSASSLSSGSHTIICDKPKLKNVFKELLPLATNWMTIGTLLGIEEHVLDMIKSDENGVNDQLRKMISEWLKRVDPAPTWRDLADAVDFVDTAKAQEIRARTASM